MSHPLSPFKYSPPQYKYDAIYSFIQIAHLHVKSPLPGSSIFFSSYKMVLELERPRITEIHVRMDCNGCVQKVKKALNGINGDLYIDFPQQKLTIVGWADPERIIKAIKKVRKVATICSHTEAPDPNSQSTEPAPPPDGGAPPQDGGAPPPEEAPPQDAEHPQPAEPQQSEAPPPPPPQEPPRNHPPPENSQAQNPQSESNPPPEPQNSQPTHAYGPTGVEEVKVVYHNPPRYSYRYGYPNGHAPGYSYNHGAHWSSHAGPSYGHERSPQPSYHEPQPQPSYHEPQPQPIYHKLPPQSSYHEPPPSYHQPPPPPSYHEPPPQPRYHEPVPPPQPVYHERPRPIYHEPPPLRLSHEKPYTVYHEPPSRPVYHEPPPRTVYQEPPPQSIQATHNYNMYRPSPSVTEYQYVQSSPQYTAYGTMDPYNMDPYRYGGASNGNFSSIFSDENPNACTIV